MIRATVFSTISTREKALLELEREYLLRFRGAKSLEIKELGGEKHSSLEPALQKAAHTKLLTTKIPTSTLLFVLDEKGKQFTTEEFSRELEKHMNLGVSHFSFAIGGPFGWQKSELPKTAKLLSLSKLTFPYQMTRLILIEQLYRVSCVLEGHPYHK